MSVEGKMLITYLGHAGFCVETSTSIVVMDPWMSPTGAFDSAWFQFPRNHELAALVQEKLQDATKERFVYISHEHKDHFDLGFLNSLPTRDFVLIVPHFRRPAIRELLSDYECKGLVSLHDGEQKQLADGSITLFLDDSELDRDSAVLVRADGFSFLNINDCKLHDRLPQMKRELGAIDVFACQFSGATWHPTCYDYPEAVYQRISKKKMIGKFEATAKAIEALQPRMYLPSAGPPCFLDPVLTHLNFEPVNTFPRAPKLLSYLERRLAKTYPVPAPDIMPGDVIDAETLDFVYMAPERVTEDDYETYMRSYIEKYEGFFAQRRYTYPPERLDQISERLRAELERKLAMFTLRRRVDRILYVRFTDDMERMLRVDFQEGRVEVATEIAEHDHYLMAAPSWEIGRVLDGLLTWEDFSLTFRMRLSREPDIYQTLIQGFLIMEPDDLNHFCARILELETRRERIIVEASGCRYSVNRFCPHQGGDLTEGWVEEGRYLVCARHRWRFDLHNDGRSETSANSIDAVALEEI